MMRKQLDDLRTEAHLHASLRPVSDSECGSQDKKRVMLTFRTGVHVLNNPVTYGRDSGGAARPCGWLNAAAGIWLLWKAG